MGKHCFAVLFVEFRDDSILLRFFSTLVELLVLITKNNDLLFELFQIFLQNLSLIL